MVMAYAGEPFIERKAMLRHLLNKADDRVLQLLGAFP